MHNSVGTHGEAARICLNDLASMLKFSPSKSLVVLLTIILGDVVAYFYACFCKLNSSCW